MMRSVSSFHSAKKAPKRLNCRSSQSLCQRIPKNIASKNVRVAFVKATVISLHGIHGADLIRSAFERLH